MKYIVLILVFIISNIVNTSEIDILVSNLETISKCNLLISSGYRTRRINKRVGGASNSYHLRNLARDLVIIGDCKYNYLTLGKLATNIFNGVIIYSRHIHVDMRRKIFHTCFLNKKYIALESKTCFNVLKSQKLGRKEKHATHNWRTDFDCSL